MQKYFFLQQEELLVLAALYEIDRIYAVKDVQLSEEQIPYKIHQMTREGVLGLKGVDIYVLEPYKTIMQRIKNSTGFMTALNMEKNERKIWFYIGDGIVYLEESRMDVCAYKIGLLQKEEMFSFLKECEFVLDELLDRELSGLEAMPTEYSESISMCLYTIKDKYQISAKELTIVRSIHNYWMRECYDSKVVSMEPYEKEKLQKIVNRWMEEN